MFTPVHTNICTHGHSGEIEIISVKSSTCRETETLSKLKAMSVIFPSIYAPRFFIHSPAGRCLGCFHVLSSVQSLSHIQLCDPMNHSTPGLPVHHQLPEFT